MPPLGGCARADLVLSNEDNVTNLSVGGCLIETDRAMELGEKYHFEWHPDAVDQIISRDGVVVWKMEMAAEPGGTASTFCYGIQFLDTSRAAAAEVVKAAYTYRLRKGVPIFNISRQTK